jgi:hypothetical protein
MDSIGSAKDKRAEKPLAKKDPRALYLIAASRTAA